MPCSASGLPLLSTWDFSASLRLPEWGLKNVSRRNTNETSVEPSGSRPDSPMRDWLRLFGVMPVMEWLLFLEMMDSLPAGK